MNLVRRPSPWGEMLSLRMTLTIPKADQAKPRRIPIGSGAAK